MSIETMKNKILIILPNKLQFYIMKKNCKICKMQENMKTSILKQGSLQLAAGKKACLESAPPRRTKARQ